MSKDEQTTDKPTAEPTEAAPPKQRKIVRRSGTTRDNPAFTEAPAGEAPPAAAPAAAAPADAPAAAPAHEGGAPSPGPAADGPRPRPRATFDARAPRPRPGPGDARPARPSRGGSMGGDYRPPPARPIGARPIPGGSRAPAPENGGDYRAPPARPIGARPIPGGPRAPAAEGHDDRRPAPFDDGAAGGPKPRAPSERSGDRPPRADRGPRPERSGDRHPRADRGPRPAPHAAPSAPVTVREPARPAAPAAHKPAPRPPAPAPVKAVAKPVAKPVFIPLARAGQVAPASARPALTPKEALAAKTKAHAAKTAVKAKAPESAPAPAAAFDAELLQAGADEAVAALLKAGEGAAALVDAWAAASNAAAVVEAAEVEAVPASARKAARRALNVLRSRGVAIPARAAGSKPEEATDAVVEATFSPPDVQGTVVISLTKREASGRYHLAEVVLREPFGILQAGAGWLSGSQLKEQSKRTLQAHGILPVPVPVPWARHRIASARRLNAASGVPVPLGFERCLPLMEPAPESAPPHPLADLEAAVTPGDAAAAAPISGRLYMEPEFRGWWPERAAINELLTKVGARIGPDAGGDQTAVDAIFMEEMSAATDRYFTPELRTIIAAHMRDAALSLRARKGDRAASEALGVARAVVEAGLITSPPREIPFLVAFFQAGLTYLAQQDGGRLRLPSQQTSEALG